MDKPAPHRDTQGGEDPAQRAPGDCTAVGDNALSLDKVASWNLSFTCIQSAHGQATDGVAGAGAES